MQHIFKGKRVSPLHCNCDSAYPTPVACRVCQTSTFLANGLTRVACLLSTHHTHTHRDTYKGNRVSRSEQPTEMSTHTHTHTHTAKAAVHCCGCCWCCCVSLFHNSALAAVVLATPTGSPTPFLVALPLSLPLLSYWIYAKSRRENKTFTCAGKQQKIVEELFIWYTQNSFDPPRKLHNTHKLDWVLFAMVYGKFEWIIVG